MLSTRLVSVVMSVYNGEKYLNEAVDSILNQTYRNFEFIIIDDGSTDNSPAILKEYAAMDARIRFISREHRGLPKSANEGIALSAGGFIARMDSDDVAAPERFQKQLDYLEANQRCVAVGAEVMLIDEQGRPLGHRGHPHGHWAIRRSLLMGNGGTMTHPAVMIRRGAIQKISGYNEGFETTSDLDLFLRLSEVGLVENLPDVLLSWRQHPRSMNRTLYHTRLRKQQQIICDVIKRIGPDRYTEELFSGEFNFDFPKDPLVHARTAFTNGQLRTALYYAWRAARHGPDRLRALDLMLTIGIRVFRSLIVATARRVLRLIRV